MPPPKLAYSSVDHPLTRLTRWVPEEEGYAVNDHIFGSQSNSNSYLVTTSAGDVVINTGTTFQAPRHRERFEQLLGRPLDVKKITFTQSHPDHVGGWAVFDGDRPGVETIAQANLPEGRLDWPRFGDFFRLRFARIMGRKNAFPMVDPEELRRAYYETPEPELTTTFADSYAFTLGERRFELYSVPGGETTDSLAVWLPDERTVFIGNLIGALYEQMPHLSTIRGDRLRSARLFVKSVDRIRALEPELLLAGYDRPVRGADEVRAFLTRARDATQYIHDETVKGMNAGKDLWTLMAEIELPPELQHPTNRGPASWNVRAVWEEYTGWFRMESPTELFPVPPRAVYPELAELAGGPDALVERARVHLDAGRPVEALHFVEIALAGDTGHRAAREAQIEALRQLADATGGTTFDDLAYFENEIALAQAALDS